MIAKDVEACHGLIANPELPHLFTVLTNCEGKLDCFMYEMLVNGGRHPKLNTRTGSIRAKVFTLNTYGMLNNSLAGGNFNS